MLHTLRPDHITRQQSHKCATRRKRRHTVQLQTNHQHIYVPVAAEGALLELSAIALFFPIRALKRELQTDTHNAPTPKPGVTHIQGRTNKHANHHCTFPSALKTIAAAQRCSLLIGILLNAAFICFLLSGCSQLWVQVFLAGLGFQGLSQLSSCTHKQINTTM